MKSFEDSFAFWSSVLGTVLAVLSLNASSLWLAALGFLLLAGAIVVLLYAGQQRERLRLSTIKIEDRSIDALNVANAGRRLNRSLVVQEAHQLATITGEDMVVTWRYAGYCLARNESAVEFSVDADNHIPFERLECYAYDLRSDPKRMHRIRPVLLGPDGLSKKLAVPLLSPLSSKEPFNVVLTCALPGCMKSGIEYYASTASVMQGRIPKSAVRIVFVGERPLWLRVYECDKSGAIRLLKDLRPTRETNRSTEYEDLEDNLPARSARIYMFRRDAITARH